MQDVSPKFDPASIRVLLFDLGGVCVTLSGAATVTSWLSGRMDMSTFWEKWLTSPSVRAFESGRMEATSFSEAVIQEFPVPVDAETFLAHFASWVDALTPGIKPLLDTLSDRYTVCCLSNTNAVHWKRLSGHLGLADCFHHCFASHKTGFLKPDAEAFGHVVETLGVPASSILFLDDLPQNVKAAQMSGLSALHVNRPEEIEHLLSDHGIHGSSALNPESGFREY